MAEQHVTYHATGTVPKAFIWGTMVVLPTMVDCVDEGVNLQLYGILTLILCTIYMKGIAIK